MINYLDFKSFVLQPFADAVSEPPEPQSTGLPPLKDLDVSGLTGPVHVEADPRHGEVGPLGVPFGVLQPLKDLNRFASIDTNPN